MLENFGRQTNLSFVVIVASLLLGLGSYYFLKRRGRGEFARSLLWGILTAGTVLVMVVFTVLPIGIRSYHDRALVLIPFAGGEYANVNRQLIIQKIFGNVALFIPLGFCLRQLTRWKFRLCLGAGFLVTFVAESVQYAIARGTSTTADLLLNSIGTGIGVALAISVSNVANRSNDDLIT